MVDASTTNPNITVLGIGNILLTDEGFGIRVIEKLFAEYEFPDHVSLVDGGVLGINLLGVIAEAQHLIVVDAVKNKQPPGTLYRLEKDELPERILLKNSLHQTDFLETLTLCQAIDKVPQSTVVLGVEPEDILTHSVEMTPTVAARVDDMMDLVIRELEQLGVTCRKRMA
jgi:hydrogenase maturation protease